MAIGLVVLVSLVAIALVWHDSLASRADVVVFPTPGSRVASPRTQIAFRNVSFHELHSVSVSGSLSGVHSGKVRAHSDGHGGSFLPDKPFAPGELVTVRTGFDVKNAHHRQFRFTVAMPAGPVPNAPLPPVARVPGDVRRFRSMPGLAPAAVSVHKAEDRTDAGDIFLAPQQGPVQNGPMIVDEDGDLVWFKPMGIQLHASDFRVQQYQGKRVLTWWQGYSGAGVGVGEDVIMDASYRQIATVHAANGLSADLHEFRITPRGTALITAYFPVYWDGSTVGAAKRQIVLDSVVQEIDINTGLLVFEWDSLDHVPVDAFENVPPKSAGAPLDYFHVNSIDEDRDGNLLISGRNTWAVYKVDHSSGKVVWTLGGKRSSFKIREGASFAFQHDVRVRAPGDRVLTLFDNGGGPPRIHQSRGLTLALDLQHMTATRAAEQAHSPPLGANFEGNVQVLPHGHVFVGWGQQAYFAEYGPSGQVVLDGRFVAPTAHYRAYRFRWSAQPSAPPAVATSRSASQTTVYASWNGATDVASWRVLGGDAAGALKPLATAPKQGFETAITVGLPRYVCVQALDASGRRLGTSPVVPAQS